MPGGDALRAERHGVVEERLELDLGVAEHVGVGRAAGAVLGEEAREHALAVFGGEVDRLDLDADRARRPTRRRPGPRASSSIRRRRRPPSSS